MPELCPSIYPPTCTQVHGPSIPTDKAWCVKGGTAIHVPNHDIRFPLIWKVESHPLTEGDFISWVVVFDTSPEGRPEEEKYIPRGIDNPLGPNSYMDSYGRYRIPAIPCLMLSFLGLIQVKPGTIVYARPLVGPVDDDGYRTAEDDMFLAAAGDGCGNASFHTTAETKPYLDMKCFQNN